MTGKEALKRIGHLEYGCDYLENSTPLKASEEYKTIERELDELKEELEIANDNLKTKQWFNDNQFNLLMKYKRAFEILKDNIDIELLSNEEDYLCKPVYVLDIYGNKQVDLTQEEYELLEELLNG